MDNSKDNIETRFEFLLGRIEDIGHSIKREKRQLNESLLLAGLGSFAIGSGIVVGVITKNPIMLISVGGGIAGASWGVKKAKDERLAIVAYQDESGIIAHEIDHLKIQIETSD